MTSRLERIWQIGVVLAVLGSFAWVLPGHLRHRAGIVVLETAPFVPPSVAPQAERVNIAAIVAAAPFGRAQVDLVPQTDAVTRRPDLSLRGIVASNGAASSAVLDVAGALGLYRENMQVAETLTLVRIGVDFVELEDRDGRITLWFDDASEAVATDSNPDAPDAPSLLAQMGEGLVVPARYVKPGQPETTSEYIDYWRHRIRKNPAQVLQDIGLEPTDAGYVIANLHDVGVRLAGLRAGDLVRSVNGQAVGDPDQDRRLYDVIAAAGQARLEVERDGRTLSFSFPLR